MIPGFLGWCRILSIHSITRPFVDDETAGAVSGSLLRDGTTFLAVLEWASAADCKAWLNDCEDRRAVTEACLLDSYWVGSLDLQTFWLKSRGVPLNPTKSLTFGRGVDSNQV